jgi:hypothetical protein
VQGLGRMVAVILASALCGSWPSGGGEPLTRSQREKGRRLYWAKAGDVLPRAGSVAGGGALLPSLVPCESRTPRYASDSSTVSYSRAWRPWPSNR